MGPTYYIYFNNRITGTSTVRRYIRYKNILDITVVMHILVILVIIISLLFIRVKSRIFRSI
jgi:hypothetical protein